MKPRIGIRALQYSCAIIVVFIIIVPIYWIVVSSFKQKSEILTFPPRLLPAHFTLENYANAILDYDIFKFLNNSLIITVSTVVLSIAIAVMAAFALSFFKFGLGKKMTVMLYLLQVLPIVTLIVPLFIMFSYMGLLNTHASLILTYTASVTGTPIAIILLCGYFQEIPKELFESAHMDGASTMKSFYKILLPLGSPGIAVTAIYIFILTWQEFMFAVNLVTNKDLYTMPVGLQMFVGEYSTDWGGMMAASTLIAVPAIILFVAVQNYFIDNLAGSVKG